MTDVGEVTEVMSLTTRERAEIDIQVSTAKAYPRSLAKFAADVRAMVTLNESVADDCIYAVPRGRGTIEGPSSRLAEIVASAYGNCRIAARVVNVGYDMVTAQGVFHDIERNVAVVREVTRRITDSEGRRYSADMIQMTGNAAASIAARNAVFAGVPKAMWEEFYQLALSIVAGTAETLAKKREKALLTVLKFGITHERCFARLGVKGPEEIQSSHLLLLRGLLTAIKDGDATVDKTFPDPNAKVEEDEPAAPAAGMAGLKVAVAAKAAKSESATETEPEHMVETPANPNDPRPACEEPGCTSEQAMNSRFCESHQPKKGKQKRSQPEPQAEMPLEA